jgi:hypothetical protein
MVTWARSSILRREFERVLPLGAYSVLRQEQPNRQH